MLYPLLFHPIYKEMVWGGQKMADTFNRELPYANTGESWDITCRNAEMGIVANGSLAGQQFDAVINTDREKYLGTRLARQEAWLTSFPLLVKIIDAMDNLSVQVHPTDAYAKTYENYPQGKNEMWYVLDAPEGGQLVIGLKDGIKEADFRAAIENGTVAQCLHYLPVQKGDVLNIPAGLVHAITKGVMVAEIQQNSDITYRMYDYDRVGLDGQKRELHLEKALQVTDFDSKIKKEAVPGLTVGAGENKLHYYIANEYFSIILYEINQPLTESLTGTHFIIFTCVEGELRLTGGGQTISLPGGNSAFIPAGLGQLMIEGKGRLMKSFVPDVPSDFIQPLQDAGYSLDEIRESTAL